MRLAYGEGIIVAFLAPIVVSLLGLLNLIYAVSLILGLTGIWTAVFGIAFADEKEKSQYVVWGVFVASFSTAFVLSIQYSLAIILIVVIALVLFTAARRGAKTKSAPVNNSSA